MQEDVNTTDKVAISTTIESNTQSNRTVTSFVVSYLACRHPVL